MLHPVLDVLGVTNGTCNPDEEDLSVGRPGMPGLDSTNRLHASAEALGSATIYYLVRYRGSSRWSFDFLSAFNNERNIQSSSSGCHGTPIIVNEGFTFRKNR